MTRLCDGTMARKVSGQSTASIGVTASEGVRR